MSFVFTRAQAFVTNFSIHHSVLQRLGEVIGGDRRGAGEIGDRSRDLQDAVKAARGEVQPLRRSFEQTSAALIERTQRDRTRGRAASR